MSQWGVFEPPDGEFAIHVDRETTTLACLEALDLTVGSSVRGVWSAMVCGICAPSGVDIDALDASACVGLCE